MIDVGAPMDSEIVRRAMRAAAELEGVPVELATRAAVECVTRYPDLANRPELIDFWLAAIRQRISLLRSGLIRKSG